MPNRADPRGAIENAQRSPYMRTSPFLAGERADIARTEQREDTQAFQKSQSEEARASRASEAEANRMFRMESLKAQLAMQERLGQDTNETRRMIAQFARANRPEEPLVAVMIDGRPTMVPRSQAIGKQPAARGGQAMSATAQKELIQTDEEIAGSQAALTALANAKKISPQAMGGIGSGALATAGSILPDALRPEGVDATMNLDNIVTESALPQLKSIFGGMPTEGERKILLDIQGSSSKPDKVRQEIYSRAEAAINRRLEVAKRKAQQLRDGTYFASDGAAAIPGPAAPAAASRRRYNPATGQLE